MIIRIAVGENFPGLAPEFLSIAASPGDTFPNETWGINSMILSIHKVIQQQWTGQELHKKDKEFKRSTAHLTTSQTQVHLEQLLVDPRIDDMLSCGKVFGHLVCQPFATK
jgi:hypothetical protein